MTQIMPKFSFACRRRGAFCKGINCTPTRRGPTFHHRKVAPAEGGHPPPAASGASQAIRKAFISPGLTDKKSTRQLRRRQNLRVVCFTGSQLDLFLLLLAFQVPHLYGAGKKRGQRAQAP